MTRYTEPQKRALLALPADGSWLVKPPGTVARWVSSLSLYHGNLATDDWGDFGPRGGRCRRCCLTPAGIAARAALIIDGADR